jgi:hypothetical protein
MPTGTPTASARLFHEWHHVCSFQLRKSLSLQTDLCNKDTPYVGNAGWPRYCRKSGRLVFCNTGIIYCTSHGGWDQGSVCTKQPRLTAPLDVHLELTELGQKLLESATNVTMLLPGGKLQVWCSRTGCVDQPDVWRA